MDNAIEITGLRKEYKGFTLEDVTFAVPRGTIMGLIGPNGAGKTTIVKLIMNLIRRDAGEVRVFGRDNLRHEPEIKSRIGFVYDVPRFPEDLRLKTIASAVSAFYEGWDDSRFRDLLEEFRLSPRQVFKKLSHGLKMKFSLAIALAHGADLILMDEPTAGLDPVFRFELLTKLRALIQDERKTVLFSSHITSDLERVADYVTFIHQGRVVFSAAKDEILDTWGVIRAAGDGLRPEDIPGARGFRRTEHSLEVLTSDLAAARRSPLSGTVIDKASLEDIMFFIGKGNAHA
ncbi:MAG: sodium ABC transporter ATP-binding protein [Candidatus Aminicenantes bacterium RBG_16_63_14]|nr:MAG: sodium ABC transporter ATP-binding protein [Candidatus Aminicenantes bacterium RBG_16_63_14]OGD25822.1 MAG: sodium ABC transporter ATP-binding protein [Candidatus Aminicenantes bacterium RBG_19FT_COMBO_65_30]